MQLYATIGINSLRKIHEGTLETRYAEIDAMLKLPRQRKISRLNPISLIVIGINKLNELKNSKPCYNCLMRHALLYHVNNWSINRHFLTTYHPIIHYYYIVSLIYHLQIPYILTFNK